MKRTIIHRLEQALRFWEDYAVFHSLIQKVYARLGAGQIVEPDVERVYLAAGQFRQYLLNYRGKEFDTKRFCLPYETDDEDGWKLNSVVYPLAQWTANSRRVFHLTADLQALLNATSLEGVQWSDVTWPFNAFAVTLESPIKGEVGEYDCILVSRVDAQHPHLRDLPGFQFDLLTTKLEDRIPLSSWSRKRFHKAAIHEGDALKLKQILNEVYGAHFPEGYFGSSFTLADVRLKNRPVTEPYERIMGETIRHLAYVDELGELEHLLNQPELNAAMRVVVGLCLYLTTLPATTPHRSDWTPLSKSSRLDPHAITNAAEICTVTSVHRITRHELRVFTEGTPVDHGTSDETIETRQRHFEMCTHFRRGTWRRKPGTASDPSAPKVVWVRPCLVRPDRLPAAAVPGGSKQVVE